MSDIHNISHDEITITVNSELASNLATDVNYIIAYQTHHKTKVNGIKKYKTMPNGPTIIEVDGANPAIFKANTKIKKQLQTDPQTALSNPKLLLESIMTGTQESDPKIQEFFVRELINWSDLHPHISAIELQHLADIFNSPDITVGSMTAILENRPGLNSTVLINNISTKVTDLLRTIPVDLDANTEWPTLLMRAMEFSAKNLSGNWEVYSRWTKSSIPILVEIALAQLEKINPAKTVGLVNRRLADTLLNDASRRLLTRYKVKAESD